MQAYVVYFPAHQTSASAHRSQPICREPNHHHNVSQHLQKINLCRSQSKGLVTRKLALNLYAVKHRRTLGCQPKQVMNHLKFSVPPFRGLYQKSGRVPSLSGDRFNVPVPKADSAWRFRAYAQAVSRHHYWE